jgi:tetratricopeptide (TPR) repeat protein
MNVIRLENLKTKFFCLFLFFIEVSCEERYSFAEKSAFDETYLYDEIRTLMKTYYNWGELLAPAPIAISVLGQLILMSNHRLDFPIDKNMPTGGFKHIKYPKSFRTTLLQISHDGYLAFLKAHNNMGKIRTYNANVPSHIKDATRYLMSKQELYILNLLPISLGRIKEAAEQSQQLSVEVVTEFTTVMNLIEETIDAVADTKDHKEIKLQKIETDLKMTEIVKQYSDDEADLLKQKENQFAKMLGNFERRQRDIYVETSNGDECFNLNLSRERQRGQGHEKHPDVFFRAGNWKYTFQEHSINRDPCYEESSHHLLDLLIQMAQFRDVCATWQGSSDYQQFNFIAIIEALSKTYNSFQPCTSVKVILTKLAELINKLKGFKFDANKRKLEMMCRGTEEMDDLAFLVNHLRAEKIKEVVVEKSTMMENVKLADTWTKVYESQFEMLEEMIQTTQRMLKLNEQRMEIQRQKTMQILSSIKSLNLSRVTYEEAIKALKEALKEVRQLKGDWDKLIKFFSNVANFIDEAAKESFVLIDAIHSLSEDISGLDVTVLVEELLGHIGKANEAAFLVHEIANMYVTVSEKYILDSISTLDTMISIDVKKVGLVGIKRQQIKLSEDGRKAYEGILQMIKDDEDSIEKKILKRHHEIEREYGWIANCKSPE